MPQPVRIEYGVVRGRLFALDGVAIADTVLVYPKGSGSTVAPYVLMGLIYTDLGPKAVVNRDICPLTLPACSLLGVPYGHGFGDDPCMSINSGDTVEFRRKEHGVELEVLERVAS